MIDARLSLIAAVLNEPNKPLKFYIEMSRVSRATFFKAKSDLEQRNVVHLRDGKTLQLNPEEAIDFLDRLYPGLANVFQDIPDPQSNPNLTASDPNRGSPQGKFSESGL